MKILLIALGGALGAVSRFLITKFSNDFFGTKLPYGTLIVNVLGSFLLGWLYMHFIHKHNLGENFRVFAAVGFLGALTTFSTFSVESLALMKDGSPALFLINISLNLVLSLCAAGLGMYVGIKL